MRLLTLFLAAGPLVLGGDLNSQLPSPAAPAPATASTLSDHDLLRALAAQIKGREMDPAESVYKNIQILKGRPALAVLNIMDIAYNRSLGVPCSYCHDPSDWASDVKDEKRITRKMSGMVHDINEKLLPAIGGLKSEKPGVNCTTCHRGQEKPALDLEPAPAAGH